MTRKFKFIIPCILIMLLNTIAPTYANKIGDLQKQLEKIGKDMQKTESLLKSIEQEKQGALYAKEKLDQEIDMAENELAEIDQLLQESDQKIAEKQKQLAQASQNVEKQDGLLKQRIRIMYEEGSVSYLEILLGAESFSDFLSRYEIIKEIVHYDQVLFEEMLQYKSSIMEAKQQLEEEKVIREKLKNHVEIRKRELDEKKVSRNLMLQRLTQQQRDYEKALEQLEKTSKEVEKEIKRQQALNNRKYVGGKLNWPTPGYYGVNSPYGNRLHPVTKKWKLHTGIDIGAPRNASVVAANDGVVIFAGWNGGYGKCVIIDHGSDNGKGIATLYAHNNQLLVKANQQVKKGQVIAKIGTTGVSTGPHLHYEVRENGGPVDPMKYYK